MTTITNNNNTITTTTTATKFADLPYDTIIIIVEFLTIENVKRFLKSSKHVISCLNQHKQYTLTPLYNISPMFVPHNYFMLKITRAEYAPYIRANYPKLKLWSMEFLDDTDYVKWKRHGDVPVYNGNYDAFDEIREHDIAPNVKLCNKDNITIDYKNPIHTFELKGCSNITVRNINAKKLITYGSENITIDSSCKLQTVKLFDSKYISIDTCIKLCIICVDNLTINRITGKCDAEWKNSNLLINYCHTFKSPEQNQQKNIKIGKCMKIIHNSYAQIDCNNVPTRIMDHPYKLNSFIGLKNLTLNISKYVKKPTVAKFIELPDLEKMEINYKGSIIIERCPKLKQVLSKMKFGVNKVLLDKSHPYDRYPSLETCPNKFVETYVEDNESLIVINDCPELEFATIGRKTTISHCPALRRVSNICNSFILAECSKVEQLEFNNKFIETNTDNEFIIDKASMLALRRVLIINDRNSTMVTCVVENMLNGVKYTKELYNGHLMMRSSHYTYATFGEEIRDGDEYGDEDMEDIYNELPPDYPYKYKKEEEGLDILEYRI